jgi:hypothetical protein
MKYVTSEWYKLYSPTGLENTFNKSRNGRLSAKGGSSAPDYIESMIRFELDSAGINAKNIHKPIMDPIYADAGDVETNKDVTMYDEEEEEEDMADEELYSMSKKQRI